MGPDSTTNLLVQIDTVSDAGGLEQTQAALKETGDAATSMGAQIDKALGTTNAELVGLGDTAEEYAANMRIIAAETEGAYGGIAIASKDTATGIVDANTAVALSDDDLLENMEVSNATILALYAARTEAATSSAAKQSAANDATSGLAEGASSKLGLAGALSNPYVVAGAAIAGAAYESVKAETSFQQALVKLYNTAGETMPLQQLSTAIEGVATSTGESLSSLTAALYHISSTGFDAAGGIKILTAASQGAQEEGADLTTVANTLVGVMHDWGASSGQATGYMNQLITATSLGNMTLQDLTAALPTVDQVAQKAGLSFAQVAGALATITENGTSANEAADQLRSLIQGIITPTADASKQLQDYGLNVVSLQQNLGKEGLTGTLDQVMQAVAKNTQGGNVFITTMQSAQVASQNMAREIAAMPPQLQSLAKQLDSGKISFIDYRNAVQALPEGMANLGKQFETTYNAANSFNNLLTSGTSPAVQTVIGVLKELFPNINATQAVLALTGTNAGTAATNVDKVAKAGSDAGKSVQGWNDQQKTLNTQLDKMKSSFEVTAVTIGHDLTPAVSTLFSGLGDYARVMDNYLTLLPRSISDDISGIGKAFDAVGDIGGKVGGVWDDLFGSSDSSAKIETRAQQIKDISKAVADSTQAVKDQTAASKDAASAQTTVQTAENNVTTALDKYKSNSPQYIKAKQDLGTASSNLQQQLANEVTANLTVMSSAYKATQAQNSLGLAIDTVDGFSLALQPQLSGVAGKIASIGINAQSDMVPLANLQGGISMLSTSWNGFSNSIQSQDSSVNQILMESGTELNTLQSQSTKLNTSLAGAVSSVNALSASSGKGIAITGTTNKNIGIPISGSFASGTSYAPGGPSILDEQGPEVVDLPTGSRVYPARQSAGMSGASGGITINQSNQIYTQVDLTIANRDLGWQLANAIG